MTAGRSIVRNRAHALLTVEEMYAADRAATEAGVPGTALMENAGRAVARAVMADWSPRPVLVLAGPGNNGGDGFVAARLLAEAGWPVRVALLGKRENLSGDAGHHAAQWRGEVGPLMPEALEGAGLVVDALFGAGLSRPLEGAVAAIVTALNERGLPVVAVDVPSGLKGDDGSVLGELCVRAGTTITFFRKKPAHLLLPGRELCGRVDVADIGIPDSVLKGIAPGQFENHPELWQAAIPWRRPGGHKYDYGHAVVRGGAVVTGAGRLAADAALRVGAGLVTVASPTESLAIYALANPSLIMAPLAEDSDWEELIADPRRNAVLVGPGNGRVPATRAATLACLAAGKATVVDADALTVFEERPDDLFAALAEARAGCILTPHEGEFRRIFPDLTGSKLERARAAARRSGAVVLLKGYDSVVAAPDGLCIVNANAPPDLATAGTGDVLSGLLAGLLAQGLDAPSAAAAGVWIHGACAARLGSGLIAADLAPCIPPVLRWLRGRKSETSA